MKYFYALRSAYKSHYLLAASASIIILGFLGSINVFYITTHVLSFWWLIALLISVFATMRFLAFFLSNFAFNRVFEAFLSGVIAQLVLLLVITLI